MNPYWAANFFEFIVIFFHRCILFLTGKLPFAQMASDEQQILILVLLGLSSSIVGSFVLLKKSTMMANSISHTVLVGIVGACIVAKYAFGVSGSSMLILSFPTLLLASVLSSFLTIFLTEFFVRVFKVQRDASIGFVFTFLFALGVVLVTLFTRNTHIGVDVVMGNLDALHPIEIRNAFLIALMNVVCGFVFYKHFLLSAFDPAFGVSIGKRMRLSHYLLMFLTTVTIVAGFKAVGVVTVLALLIAPVLKAKERTHHLPTSIAKSFGVVVFYSVVSVALSRHLLSCYDLPISTSGLFVSILFVSYLAQMGMKGILARVRMGRIVLDFNKAKWDAVR
ncbi:MAG: hypothetical protein S4CHLAM102_08220 [Chlamydiia bacterium]|nr:hypothetical protein [Chlamydiia bacterium]